MEVVSPINGCSGDTAGKVIICKAAVAWGPGQPFVIEKIRVEPPQKMEVRVKILYSSICHTDLSAWKGQNEAQRVYPRIFGHEASGIVESVGEGVVDVAAGDHVIPLFNGECGTCRCCQNPNTNTCEKMGVNPMKSTMVHDGQTRFTTADERRQPIYHFLNTSTFSEFTVLESACVVKIDSEAPIKKMTLLSCGLSTGVGAAWNTANVEAGSTVAIFGLGAVGLAVAEGARARGASKIIGVDVNSHKSTIGKQFGITDFINPTDSHKPVHEIIVEMTNGGVDYSFECVGGVEVLRTAFLSTHIGWGTTVMLGIHTTPEMLPLHPMELFDGRKVVASVFGGFKGRTQIPHFAKQCILGVVKLDEFITDELPFEDINSAFKRLVDGKSLRCLLYL
ncbi:alcohol dehydrogenase-like 4 [Cucurbita pepo subsp. pepo]|uniref:alcohol dehydrogenase-like 4 n=1 Tax=Cucurbita pepo subsp. pepo TaxID=3664 RepID=UPI000C9D7EC9|nr:alcohol dehydrogenase-like 4 [Cucurbita pepo subsp. pepo]